MPKKAGRKPDVDKGKELVIKAALRAYPDRDLLPVDFETMSLEQLLAAARKNQFGDTLISFIIFELHDGLDSEDWDRAAELIERAKNELDAVLGGLFAAEMAKAGGGTK